MSMSSLFAGSSSGSSDSVALTMGASAMGLGDNPCPCCELTFMQRLQGFGACFGIGMLISFLSTIKLWAGNMRDFAVMYSIGNMVALLSMGFLMGACRMCCAVFVCLLPHLPPLHTNVTTSVCPKSQCKNMFHETRRIATVIYLILLIVTLVVATQVTGSGSVVLVILCVIAQFLALCWYTLSYIPFARQMVMSCLGSCVGR